MSDQATLAFYQEHAPHYTMSFGQAPSPQLDAFLDRLKPAARVLELGCGGGRDAAHMVSRGFDVDPTDGTPAMVKKAQERFDLPARVMRFEQLDAQEEYDAVWAHASLLHLARADLRQVLQSIVRALRRGGWHYANFKLGNGEDRDSLGRLYNFPSREWLLKQYQSIEGWQVIDTKTYIGGGFDNVQRDWLALTLQKCA